MVRSLGSDVSRMGQVSGRSQHRSGWSRDVASDTDPEVVDRDSAMAL